jgi:hypothetical protein
MTAIEKIEPDHHDALSVRLLPRQENPYGLVGRTWNCVHMSFPVLGLKEDMFVLVLQAYFDESGTHHASLCAAVGGYISTEEQWELFSIKWNQELANWKIPFFHMSDFSTRAGVYASWTEIERRDRLSRLIYLINQHTIASVGSVVSREDFSNSFKTAEAKRHAGDIYGVAAISCFIDSSRLINPGYSNAKIAYIFESGQNTDALKKCFDLNYNDPDARERLKLNSLAFQGKEFAPLQAADIISYEMYKSFPFFEGMTMKHGPRTHNWNMLKDCPLHSWGRLHKESVDAYAKAASLAIEHGFGWATKR